MVILISQNKITNFLMILAWACPFNSNITLIAVSTMILARPQMSASNYPVIHKYVTIILYPAAITISQFVHISPMSSWCDPLGANENLFHPEAFMGTSYAII